MKKFLLVLTATASLAVFSACTTQTTHTVTEESTTHPVLGTGTTTTETTTVRKY